MTVKLSDFPSCFQNCTAHLYVDDFQIDISYEPGLVEFATDQINSDLEGVVRSSVMNALELNV